MGEKWKLSIVLVGVIGASDDDCACHLTGSEMQFQRGARHQRGLKVERLTLENGEVDQRAEHRREDSVVAFCPGLGLGLRKDEHDPPPWFEKSWVVMRIQD